MASRSRWVRATTQTPRSEDSSAWICLRYATMNADWSSRLSKCFSSGSGPRVSDVIPWSSSGPPSEIIDGAAGQQAGGPPAGLLGGAVIQAQLPRSVADIDAATADPVRAVDALVTVDDDEEIVGVGRHDVANQAIRLRAHVLRLVHDHRSVAELVAVVLEQHGGIAVRVVHLLEASFGELGAVLLKHAPRLGAGGPVEAAAPA